MDSKNKQLGLGWWLWLSSLSSLERISAPESSGSGSAVPTLLGFALFEEMSLPRFLHFLIAAG